MRSCSFLRLTPGSAPQVDIFKERILVSSIRAYFPDYEGDDTDYNAAREYFKARFTRLNRSQSKEICATFSSLQPKILADVELDSLQTLITRRLSTRTSSEFVVAALPRARRELTHIALQVVMASVYDIIVTRNLNDIIL